MVCLYGCADKEVAQEDSTAEEDLIEAEDKIMSFNLAGYTEAGRKKWDVEGESADILGNMVNLTNIKGKSYGKDTVLTLTADGGVFDRANNDINLKKNVLAVTDEGTKLTTESLNWQNKTQMITTEDLVKIEKENFEAIGMGAFAKPQLKEATLKKDVTVKVKPDTVITCAGPLDIDYGKDVAVFHNDVKVVNVEGDIYADKITVYFEPKKRKIDRVRAVGNVRIVRGRNFTFSKKAEYFALNSKVILTGKPKVELYPKESDDNVLIRN